MGDEIIAKYLSGLHEYLFPAGGKGPILGWHREIGQARDAARELELENTAHVLLEDYASVFRAFERTVEELARAAGRGTFRACITSAKTQVLSGYRILIEAGNRTGKSAEGYISKIEAAFENVLSGYSN